MPQLDCKRVGICPEQCYVFRNHHLHVYGGWDSESSCNNPGEGEKGGEKRLKGRKQAFKE